MVTDEQVRLLRRKRLKMAQEAAAAAAGMSVRAAREWEVGPMPSETKELRGWRTRKDPFVEVWESEVVPLLTADERGVLEAKTVLEALAKAHPEKKEVYAPSRERTLQRRMRDWRALYGPAKEVFFPQVHVPGREAAIDFTHATELGVTVRGAPLVHLFFEMVLSFSGWTWLQLAYRETFEALVRGVQGAFWELGGVTAVVRSDNLSAATHELNLARAQSALTSAVVDVQRGDYEPARAAISTFFTSLRAETDSETASILSPAQREALQPLFDRQDELITMLARNDTASLAQLSDLYVAYRTIMNP